jgi:hypothetical protein
MLNLDIFSATIARLRRYPNGGLCILCLMQGDFEWAGSFAIFNTRKVF